MGKKYSASFAYVLRHFELTISFSYEYHYYNLHRTISVILSELILLFLYLGFISLNNGVKNSKNLGYVENLQDILEAYKPDEILFSTEGLPTQFIIETMSKITEPIVFRLVSKNNMISSTSKNKSG